MTNKRTILITGGAGYIGTNILAALKKDYNLIVIDNFSTGNKDLFDVVSKGCDNITLADIDLRDVSRVSEIFRTNDIYAVIHLAAYSIVSESFLKEDLYYQNNVSNTLTLLHTMVQHNVMKFIFSSSASVYGETNKIPITEDVECNPTNPYGYNKLYIEKILYGYDALCKMKYVSLRYFNAAGADLSGTFGERHKQETHLIPSIMLALLQNREVVIYGDDYPINDGTAIRDYVHVTDIANAHLLALESLHNGKSNIYNIGNNNGYSVEQIIHMIEEITGNKIIYRVESRRPNDPMILVADSTKIKCELCWKPKYEDLYTIIDSAWKWHKFDFNRS